MNDHEIRLHIAREAILHRAALDDYSRDLYDPVTDPEGYLTSLLVALMHWCDAHDIDWNQELGRAAELYTLDRNEGCSP